MGTEDPRASIPLFGQDCAIADAAGDARESLNCQIALGFAYERLGQFYAAKTAFAIALPRSRQMKNARLELVCLEALGFNQARLANWREASDTLNQADDLATAKKSS